MQEKFEIITKHKLQFWTKLPKNGQCDQTDLTFPSTIVGRQEKLICWPELMSI